MRGVGDLQHDDESDEDTKTDPVAMGVKGPEGDGLQVQAYVLDTGGVLLIDQFIFLFISILSFSWCLSVGSSVGMEPVRDLPKRFALVVPTSEKSKRNDYLWELAGS